VAHGLWATRKRSDLRTAELRRDAVPFLRADIRRIDGDIRDATVQTEGEWNLGGIEPCRDCSSRIWQARASTLRTRLAGAAFDVSRYGRLRARVDATPGVVDEAPKDAAAFVREGAATWRSQVCWRSAATRRAKFRRDRRAGRRSAPRRELLFAAIARLPLDSTDGPASNARRWFAVLLVERWQSESLATFATFVGARSGRKTAERGVSLRLELGTSLAIARRNPPSRSVES
jgi:hypothetical protein